MTTRTKELFGGALFGAGVIAAAAGSLHAGNSFEFDPSYNGRARIGWNGPVYTFHYWGQLGSFFHSSWIYDSSTNVGGPLGTLTMNYSDSAGHTAMASVVSTSTVLSANAFGGAITQIYSMYDYAFGYYPAGTFAQAYTRLTPTTDLTLHLEWDSHWNGGGGVYLFGPDVFVESYYQETGDMYVTLTAGNTYGLVVHVYTRSWLNDSSAFARVTIVPAPSAFALLGLAGMIGKRRRRE